MIFDEMNDRQFADLLRRSLHERPELGRIPNLAERSIAKAALRDRKLSGETSPRSRVVRQRRGYQAATVIAVLLITCILFFGYQAIPSSSLSLTASSDYAQNASSGSSFQSAPELQLLILGGILLMMAVAAFTLSTDAASEMML